MLAEEADATADLVGAVRDVVTGDDGLAAGGPQHRAQNAHDRGLAGAVGTEQAEDLARPDLEADTVHRAHLPSPQIAIFLGEVGDLDHVPDS